MAIPKEKNLAVQLVPTVAVGVVTGIVVRLAWNAATGRDAPLGIPLSAGAIVAAAFFWWYGYMQRRMPD
jgi:hypothetical protein